MILEKIDFFRYKPITSEAFDMLYKNLKIQICIQLNSFVFRSFYFFLFLIDSLNSQIA